MTFQFLKFFDVFMSSNQQKNTIQQLSCSVSYFVAEKTKIFMIYSESIRASIWTQAWYQTIQTSLFQN